MLKNINFRDQNMLRNVKIILKKFVFLTEKENSKEKLKKRSEIIIYYRKFIYKIIESKCINC